MSSHLREILTFLHHCKKARSPASVVLIKQWLATRETQSNGPAHTALRWFYREASRQKGASGATEMNEERRGASPFDKLRAQSLPRGAGLSEIPRSRTAWRPMEPRPAAQDLGGPEWERALVKTMRVRGLLWRSEQAYRGWAQRFAAFLAPKTPEVAGAEEVGAFLTDLAVRTRASPSGQRQALNALVFLLQEALHRDLGKLEFRVYGYADAVG